MKKILLCVLFITLFLFPSFVNATGTSVTMGGNDTLKKGETVVITLTTDKDTIFSNIAGDISYDSNVLELVSSDVLAKWKKEVNTNSNPIKFKVSGRGNGDFFTASFKVKDTTSVNFTMIELQNLKATIIENGKNRVVSLANQVLNVKILSDNNYLSSLTVGSHLLTPEFTRDTTDYNVKLPMEVDKVMINGTFEDENAIYLEGFGSREVSLNYGNNDVLLKVQNELGDIRVYTLHIEREDNRSTNTNIKELFLEQTNEKLTFDKEKSEYRIEVPKDIDKVSLKAVLEDEKAAFVSDFAPKEVNLEFGENELELKVKAENESVQTYKVIIVRKDSRSHNNYLKRIFLSHGFLEFKKEVQEYEIRVPKQQEQIELEVISMDKKASVTVKNVDMLKIGENTITIEVKSEAEEVRIYTLKIIRGDVDAKLSSDNNLKHLIIDGTKVKLTNDNEPYKIKVMDRKNVNIDAVAKDNKARIMIINSEQLDNENEVIVQVTAQDSSNQRYRVILDDSNGVEKDHNIVELIAYILLIVLGFIDLGFLVKRYINHVSVK